MFIFVCILFAFVSGYLYIFIVCFTFLFTFVSVCCTCFKYPLHKLIFIAEIHITTFNSIRIVFCATGKAFQRLAIQLVTLIDATVQQ